MTTLLPAGDLDKFFDEFPKEAALGDWINIAINHYFVARLHKNGLDRFEGLAPFRSLFAKVEWPVEWLQAIWQSVVTNNPRHTGKFLGAIAYAMGALPRVEPGAQLSNRSLWGARTYIQVIRRERIGELLDAVQGEFSRPKIGWFLNDELFFETFSALQACAEHSRSRSFVESMLQAGLYRDPRLSSRHLAVFFTLIAQCLLHDELEEFLKLCKPFDAYIKSITKQLSSVGALRESVREELLASRVILGEEGRYQLVCEVLPSCNDFFLPLIGEAQGDAIKVGLAAIDKAMKGKP